MHKPPMIYRACDLSLEELTAAREHFECHRSDEGIGRIAMPSDHDPQPILARYCVLPFYKDRYQDLLSCQLQLLNSPQQHGYVANLAEWYGDLEQYTFKTWFHLSDVPQKEGPFVLKGSTNSRKQQWNSHMYAADWAAASDVYRRLQDDGLIGHQQVVIRKYEPLQNYGQAIGGLPLSKEFRHFVLDGQLLSSGFYWSSFSEDILEQGYPLPEDDCPREWLQEVICRVAGNCRFYALDVAQDITGRWWVVELNDGQMSGLSGNDPAVFYRELASRIQLEPEVFALGGL